jgi:hypothetical protein
MNIFEDDLLKNKYFLAIAGAFAPEVEKINNENGLRFCNTRVVTTIFSTILIS